MTIQAITDQLKAWNILLSVRHQNWTLACGGFSAVLDTAGAEPGFCLVRIYDDSGQIHSAGLPVCWKKNQLPDLITLLSDWTTEWLSEHRTEIRCLILTTDLFWTELSSLEAEEGADQ